jgi:hypothetical protein
VVDPTLPEASHHTRAAGYTPMDLGRAMKRGTFRVTDETKMEEAHNRLSKVRQNTDNFGRRPGTPRS